MNAIVFKREIDLFCDRTRSARYQRTEYDDSVNAAILEVFSAGMQQFQKDQTISDSLYTLQSTQSAAPTADVALYPNDYERMTAVYATIGGTSYYCRPTTINRLGPLLKDTYRRPSDTKPYCLQVPTGFKIYHGSGTVTSVSLEYLKTPATFTIGKTSQLVTTVVSGSLYIATKPTVHNSVSYNIGDEFTAAASVALTSGEAILKSNTTTCDLPESTHELIAKRASGILLGVTGNFQQSAFSEKEASES